MNLKKYSTSIYWLVSILFFIFIFLKNDINSNDICTKAKDLFLKEEYKGTVLNKKRNRKNHNMMMLEIELSNQKLDTVYLDEESKKVYDFVEEGDIIIKYSQDSVIRILRNQKMTNYIINFKCLD
jgi:cell division protein FtsB